MKHVRTVVTLSALGLALVHPGVLSAEGTTPTQPPTPASPAVPTNGDPQTQPTAPASPAVPATPPDTAASGPTGSNTGTDHTPADRRSQVSKDIRQVIDTANKARAEFLKNQQDLRSILRNADKESRDQIRSRLQEQREAFLAQQRDAREDLKQKLATLKDKLKDHRDAIDDAKDAVKDKGHGRKGD